MKEHILVIRFSALGDVAMTVPVVHALAQQYPHVRITVLSRPFARPFFESLAPNVNFMEADIKHKYHGVKGLNSLYRRLTAKQFTAIADLHAVLRSSYLRMRFNLDRYRVAHIDKHRQAKRQLTSQRNKQRRQLPTSFQNYADVFARLGYPISRFTFRSLFPEEGGQLGLLPPSVSSKPAAQPWIGIAPFAAHKGKIYPPELMEQVIGHVLESCPAARIFFFGRGEQEKAWFGKWCSKWPRECQSASALTAGMEQELILMSHLDVMLSMDSANMHLASLTATPVVSIWGATHPWAGFMGWNQQAENAIGTEMDCRPCSIYGNKPCMRGDYACLHNISPSTVAQRVLDVANTRNK